MPGDFELGEGQKAARLQKESNQLLQEAKEKVESIILN